MQIIPAIISYEEDELFYSWFSRIAMHNYSINLNEFANNYLSNGKFTDTRHPRKIKYDFTENIYYLHKALMIDKKDLYKIFHETSIFDAIAPFMNNFNKQLYYHLAIGEVREDEEYTLLEILVGCIDKLQCCPKCMDEDVRSKGFFWYHRAHQIPGVKVCYKHQCALQNFVGRTGREFEDAEYVKESVKSIEAIDVDYAIFCKELLNRAIHTNIYGIRKMIINRCTELNLEKRQYKALDEVINGSQYKGLFPQNASIFMNREEMDGTYIDPFIGIPLLFFLFDNMDNLERKLTTVHEESIVSKETFQQEFERLMEVSKFKKYLVSQTKDSSGSIEEEMYNLVGNEYALVDKYVDRVTKVKIKHNKCQQIFVMKPMTFLDGGRCPFCKVAIKEAIFKEYVSEVSEGRYMVRGKATKNLWIIHDTLAKKDILLTTQKTLQELNKKKQRYILPFEKKIDKPTKITTRDDEVYNYICKQFHKDDIIFLEDVEIDGYDYGELKHRMRRMRKSEKIEMISPGIYNFPGASFTQEDLLISQYLIRRGEHIGFFYGKTLGQELGLCESTEVVYIASNKEAQRHGRKKEIYGAKIRLKGTVAEIKEENYRVLAILDFITCYKTYTKQGKEDVFDKVKNYIEYHEITKEQVDAYIGLFPVWTKNFMDDIWGGFK